ncbi:MAG: hypothetical protein DCC75_09930 [Proteobacteria bacterium]|nr:MAG: hypothetical protein DCC75_09930 [Pseudomonadota bacterium]
MSGRGDHVHPAPAFSLSSDSSKLDVGKVLGHFSGNFGEMLKFAGSTSNVSELRSHIRDEVFQALQEVTGLEVKDLHSARTALELIRNWADQSDAIDREIYQLKKAAILIEPRLLNQDTAQWRSDTWQAQILQVLAPVLGGMLTLEPLKCIGEATPSRVVNVLVEELEQIGSLKESEYNTTNALELTLFKGQCIRFLASMAMQITEDEARGSLIRAIAGFGGQAFPELRGLIEAQETDICFLDQALFSIRQLGSKGSPLLDLVMNYWNHDVREIRHMAVWAALELVGEEVPGKSKKAIRNREVLARLDPTRRAEEAQLLENYYIPESP